MPRHVVITGLGLLSGCGAGAEVLWEALCAGKSTIGPITRFKPDGFACQLAAEVPPGLGAKDYVPKSYRKAVKVMARDTELAVIAAALAVKDAGLTTRIHAENGAPPHTTYPSERFGCQIGAGLIPAEVPELAAAFVTARVSEPTPAEIELANGFSLRAWGTIPSEEKVGEGRTATGAMNNLPPLWLLKYLPNMLACHVTILHGAEGPSNTLTCSEASGLLSLGETCRVIERGDADACFSGGAESKVNLMGMMRQSLLGRLAPAKAAEDAGASRPFDPDSSGVILGEGAGILILEEESAAQKRGVRVYAAVAGFGAAQSLGAPAFARAVDGDPAPRGRGLALAIRAALRDADLTPDRIDAVFPQGCCSRASDQAELLALREVFGERAASLPLVSLAPTIGDCAAGGGGFQAAAGALCLHHQRLPMHYLVGGDGPRQVPARDSNLGHVLVFTGSLGGQNAALVLRKA